MKIFLMLLLVLSQPAYSAGKNYGATKPYSREQQIRRGEREEIPLTTGRLAWRKILNGSLVCIYVGAGNSNETIFTGKSDKCMGNMKIEYAPDDKFNLKIAIEKLMEQE
tara:strand:- start:78 stop:404 length:327 start_codon:yes stop_codon:yes gene_type:complete